MNTIAFFNNDELTSQWPDCLDRKPRAFRVISAIWRAIEQAARDREARLALIDVGPNLGAINRAALIAAQHKVFPFRRATCSRRAIS